MDDVGKPEDVAGEPGKGMSERLAYLERRFDAREDVADRILRAEVARCVQSLGIVVDFLAGKGLLDRAELKAYIEERFLVMGAPSEGEPGRQAVDVYQWLMWSEMTEASRMRARRPNSAFYERPLVSRPGRGGAQGDLEREAGGHGDLVVEAVEE